jgi:alginate O-acetyltransferase complex protein AlgJ
MQNSKLPDFKSWLAGKKFLNATAWINFFFIAVFIGLISMGLWSRWFGSGNQEELSSFPSVKSFQSLLTFPTRFETYLTENFPARLRLTHPNYWVRYTLLDQQVFPKTLVGSDGWLYYTAEQNLADFQKTNLLNARQIENIQNNIDRLGKFSREQGIPFVLLIAPNKETIYPEHVPEIFRPLGTTSRLDQILTNIKFPDNIQVIDPRELLLRAKTDRLVYYKTDTHWNFNGVCIAYSQLMNAIQNRLPDTYLLKCENLKIVTGRFENDDLSGDLSQLLTLQKIITEDNYEGMLVSPKASLTQKNGRKWIASEIPGSTLPKIMVYRDSFFTKLVPLLSENFSSVEYWWTFQLDYERITRERPALVVLEFAERYAQVALLPEP